MRQTWLWRINNVQWKSKNSTNTIWIHITHTHRTIKLIWRRKKNEIKTKTTTMTTSFRSHDSFMYFIQKWVNILVVILKWVWSFLLCVLCSTKWNVERNKCRSQTKRYTYSHTCGRAREWWNGWGDRKIHEIKMKRGGKKPGSTLLVIAIQNKNYYSENV